MALHWIDSFTSAAVGTTPSPWGGGGGIFGSFTSNVTTGGRGGGNALPSSGYTGMYRLATFPSSVTGSWPTPTWVGPETNWYDTVSDGSHIGIVGSWVKINTNGLGTFDHSRFLFGLAFAPGLDIGYLRAREDGSFSYHQYIYNPSTGARTATEIGRTSPMRWRANGDSYIELKLTMGSSGAVVVRVNDEVVLSASGFDSRFGMKIDGKNAYYTRFGAAYLPGTGIWPAAISGLFDDIYLADGRPGSISGVDDFMGAVRATRLVPSADYVQGMTPVPPGQSWQLVDEAAPDTNDYVEGDHNKRDLYEFTDPASGTFYGVTQQIHLARMGDPYYRTEGGNNVYYGELTVDAIASSSASEAAVEIQKGLVTSSYKTVSQTFEADPATSAAWTTSGLSNARFGYRVREPSDPTIVPV